MRSHSNRRQGGQVAVLFALAAVAIVAIAGLALDAGQSFVAQRAVQAGTDTAAQSGAAMLAADYVACVSGGTLPYTTGNIAGAVTTIVEAAAAAQGKATTTPPPTAYFVTYDPSLSAPYLLIDGPISGYSVPLCTDGSWTGPSGVQSSASDTHPTFILQLVGVKTATERATGISVFGQVQGGGAPFATWDAFCYGGGTGGALGPTDPVVLYDPSWDKSTCGFKPPDTSAAFKGYIDPTAPISLPLNSGACIQTGVGVGEKTGSITNPPIVGHTYLIPMISSYQKGLCPFGTPGPQGTYALTYAGMIAVTITSESTSGNKIVGQVVSTTPTAGVTICPEGDTACSSSSAASNLPVGVELYQ
ncbi:MAG: pilus assembly protein TadG-related protein [Candidatus Dormibacteria bacterium]